MTEWQPIETAPKDGKEVDLWIDGERHPCCSWTGTCWYSPHGFAWPTDFDETDGVPTHWLRISPPK